MKLVSSKLVVLTGSLALTLVCALGAYSVLVVVPDRQAHARALRDYHNGEAALRKGKGRAAETALLSALTEWPSYAAAYSKLGDLYYASGKPELATGAYEQLASVAPHFKHVYCRIAQADMDMGETGLARTNANHELRLDPKCVRALDTLAMLDVRDDRRHATAEIEKAYRLEPANVQTIITYAQLHALDEPDKAISLLLRARKLVPASWEIDYDLGYCYARGSADPNASKLALQYLEEGAALAPGQGEIHRELCRLLMQQGNLPEAEREGELATQYDSHEPASYFNYVQVLERLGKHVQADAAEARFRVLDRADSQARTLTARYGDRPIGATPAHQLALADITLGRTREAVYVLENAIPRNPQDLRLRQDIARLFQAGESP